MRGKRMWLLLPRPLRELPPDLSAVCILVVTTILSVLLPVIRDTPLRIVLGLPFVLFLPGYALISALFPESGPDALPDSTERGNSDEDGIDGIERVALAFGLSIAITPLIGLILNFTPWGIRLLPIILSIGGFTLFASAIAAIRRWQLPPTERFTVPYRSWGQTAYSELMEPETSVDAALNIVLILSVVLATTSVVYAVAVPKQGESFTEFYFVMENESGELVADNYPTEFTRGQSRPIVIGVENNEHQPVDYTIIAKLQNVSFQNNSSVIHREQELQRYETRIGDNQTWRTTYDVTPRMTGERLRLVLLLYMNSPPEDPNIENAYRETHLWINVSARETPG